MISWRENIYRWLTVLAAAMATLIFTQGSEAHRGTVYLTEFQVEELVMESRWAERKVITDAYCTGWGRPVRLQGESTYKHFDCSLDQEVFLWGKLVTCDLDVEIHLVSLTGFRVLNEDENGCDV